MKGSIRFNNEINVEVAVDPSQDEGAKLLSAVNLVDGQELGSGGGGDFSTAEVTLINTDASGAVNGNAPIIINEEIATDISVGPQETKIYTVVLYNGTCLINFWDGAVIEQDGVEVSPPEGSAIITGNTTLKLEWSD